MVISGFRREPLALLDVQILFTRFVQKVSVASDYSWSVAGEVEQSEQQPPGDGARRRCPHLGHSGNLSAKQSQVSFEFLSVQTF